MSGNIEFAGQGRRTDFPAEWGSPVGEQFSEQRARWVRDKVREHFGRTAHRTLADKNGRLLSILRSAEMDARRECPGPLDAA